MDTIERLERRHFALPAAFVLTLLAFLFFGTPRPPVSVPLVAVPIKTPPTQGPEIEVKPYELPLPVEYTDSDTVTKPLSGGGPTPPMSEIDNSWSSKKDGFFVEVEIPRPQPGHGDIRVIPAYYGPGNGSGDHPGTAGNIVPERFLDKPPRARVQASPVYPFKEKYEGINGSVEVEFIVDETGAVVNPRVVSSTHRAFEEPTLRAVEQWRFVPGRSQGKVVSFRMRVPVLFNVND